MFYFFFLLHPLAYELGKIDVNNFETYRQYKQRTTKSNRVSHREFIKIKTDYVRGHNFMERNKPNVTNF